MIEGKPKQGRMLSAVKRIGSAFKPVEYAGWEMLIMRAAFAVAIWYAFAKIQTFTEAPSPVGIAQWIDVSIFHDGDFRELSKWIVAACMLSYVFGVFPSVTLSIAAFLFVGAATLNTSQGKIHHHLQAGGGVLCILAIWHVIASIIHRFKPHHLTRLRTYQLSVFFVLQAVAAAYVVSAVTKLDKSGLGWFTDAKYAPAAIRKTEDAAYFSTLEVRKPAALQEDGASSEPANDTVEDQAADFFPRAVQKFLLDNPWAAGWVLGPGLILELFAFLALLGRRWALAVGLLIISFHFMVGHVMNLHFELNNHLLIIFFVNIPYWVLAFGRWITGMKKEAP